MEEYNSQKNFKYFLSIIAVLLIFGIVMVYSSSYIYARENFGNSGFFLTKQIIFLSIGIFFAFIVSKSKYNFWFKNSYALNIFATILLILTFFPKIGVSIKGSYRWINLYFFTFQPSEIVKYTILLSSTKFFREYFNYDSKTKIKIILNIIAPLAVLLIQPDFGSFAICLMIIIFSSFLSDFPRKYLYGLTFLSLISASSLLIIAPYRLKRLFTYLDPWADPQNSGFQIIQSYLAFANGSLFGSGLGNSNEKLFYLPEAYNDFIFSVIGEELGFVGVILIVFLFLSFCYHGLKISLSLGNQTKKILTTSIVLIISFQAFLNMAVVLGLLPTKGLNLPFISYGGTSLIINLIAVGFFASIVNSKDESVTKNIHSNS